MPLKQMRRFKYLARPKKDTLIDKPMWILTMEMRKYKPTKRIRDLARPVIRDTSMLYTELPIQIPVHVLKAKGIVYTKILFAITKKKKKQKKKKIQINLIYHFQPLNELVNWLNPVLAVQLNRPRLILRRIHLWYHRMP